MKKGKSQKTIQLENLLDTANKEITTLKSFLLYLHDEGKITLDDTDKQVFSQIIKEVKEDEGEIIYKRGLGLADAQVSKSPSPSPSPEKVEQIRPDISEEFLADTDEEEEEEEEEDVITEKDIMDELFTDDEGNDTDDDEEEDDESERKDREITALEEVEEFLAEYEGFDFNPFMKKIKREDRAAGGDRAEKWDKDNKTDTINELLEEFIEMLEDWKNDLDDFPDLAIAIANWKDTLEERQGK